MVPRARVWFSISAAALAGVAACNAILGIEEAELIETTTTTTGTGGSPPECFVAGDCDDSKVCTIDSCNAATCQHDALNNVDAPPSQQQAFDCQRIICIEGQAQTIPDDTDLPVDGTLCTADLCNAGNPEHPNAAALTPCADQGGQVCNGLGDCVECVNDAQCTLPDRCGIGDPPVPYQCSCDPVTCAEAGKTCGTLASDQCSATNINCNNGLDGGETDVDCGGPIAACNIRCNPGKACLLNTDCASAAACCANVCCAAGQSCVAGACQ